MDKVLERLEEIKARYEAATEGPWGADVMFVTAEIEGGRPSGEVIIRCGATVVKHNDCIRDIRNGAFVAHSREDIPWMHDYILKQHTEVTRLKEG